MDLARQKVTCDLPVSTWELVTPRMAARYLECVRVNRPVRPARVELYADQMRRGEWLLCGEPITFLTDGSLRNGQHRLQAIVETGIAVWLQVNRNVREALPDVGRVRIDADFLHEDGEKNGRTLAAAIKWIIGYEETGAFVAKGPKAPYPRGVSEIRAWLEAHPSIRDSVASVGDSHHTGGRLVPAAVAAALHYLMAQRHRESADEFWRLLQTGDGLTAKNPIYVLRERLIRDRASQSRLPAVPIAALCCKAWTAWRRGETVTRFALMPNGEFPPIA